MGSPEFLGLVLAQPGTFGAAFALALLGCWVLSRLSGTWITGGLLPAYSYLAVNMTTAVFLYVAASMPGKLLSHFLLTELVLFLVIAAVYRRIGPLLVRSAQDMTATQLRSLSLVVIAALLASAMYAGGAIADDATSRVEFQLTSGAFTFIKPFTYFAVAAGAFLPFLLLRSRLPASYALATIVALLLFSLASQSKGGFLIAVVTAWRLLQEQGFFGSRPARQRPWLRAALPVVIGGVFVANLWWLEIELPFMLARIVFSSDSVFMTYAYDVPGELCTGVDSLSALHRGLARLLQAPAALDPNTIFGVRLVQLVELEDSLRGPNARVSSYALCHFGWAGTPLFLIWLSALLAAQTWLAVQCGKLVPALRMVMLPLLAATLADGAQDVYRVMTSLTICLAVWAVALVGRFVWEGLAWPVRS